MYVEAVNCKEKEEENMSCGDVLLLVVIVVGWYALGIAADERKVHDVLFYAGLCCSVLFVAVGGLINRPKNKKQIEKKKKKKID